MAAPGSTAPHVVAVVDGTTAGPPAGSKAHSEMGWLELAFWMWVVASFVGQIYLLSSFLAQKFWSSPGSSPGIELFMTRAGRKLHKKHCRILLPKILDEGTRSLEICGDCCTRQEDLELYYVEDAMLHETGGCPKIVASCRQAALCEVCHNMKKVR